MDWKLIIVWIVVGIATLSEATCEICGNVDSEFVTKVEEAKHRAIQWLAGQQNVDGKWSNVNTQNAILALQLADPNWFAGQSLDIRLLTSSRLEYELMQHLLPSKLQCRSSVRDFELKGELVGQYILALTSICTPIDDFYEIDLAHLMSRVLKDFPEDNFNNYFQYSFAILSLCSSNSKIFPKALTKLALGFDPTDPCASQFGGRSTDILSIQVMAMVCSEDQVHVKQLSRWRTVLDSRVQCIADGQNEINGSFGNAISTALAIQALTAANVDGWDCVSAMEWLLTQQSDNGDFGGVAVTVQVLPILGCNTLGGLKETNINCPHYIDLPNPLPIGEDDDTVDFVIQVKYRKTTTDYPTTIMDGESLYYGMIRLEESSNDFSFVSTNSPFGQSLEEINNIPNDPANLRYWTIHIDEEGNYAPTGIEDLFPIEGITYIYVYQEFL